MNRIDEFANAFQGWMEEWYASRKLAGGASAVLHGAGETGLVDRENEAGSVPPKSSRQERRDVPSSPGLHLVLEEHRQQMDKPLRIVSDMVKFSYLLKHEGDPNRIPHDCIENLRYLICGICGARYERGQ